MCSREALKVNQFTAVYLNILRTYALRLCSVFIEIEKTVGGFTEPIEESSYFSAECCMNEGNVWAVGLQRQRVRAVTGVFCPFQAMHAVNAVIMERLLVVLMAGSIISRHTDLLLSEITLKILNNVTVQSCEHFTHLLLRLGQCSSDLGLRFTCVSMFQ